MQPVSKADLNTVKTLIGQAISIVSGCPSQSLTPEAQRLQSLRAAQQLVRALEPAAEAAMEIALQVLHFLLL